MTAETASNAIKHPKEFMVIKYILLPINKYAEPNTKVDVAILPKGNI